VGQDKLEFVASSGPMREVLEKLRRVAALDTTVLLQGESGTGKEVAARYLREHHQRRKGGPLVCVHCGAIPDTLLESELFGHVKGAFTGADRDRIGKFEQADGGTLFLDEISTMTLEAQVRLLRVLQERRVTRLGAAESREVDVRVVVATNQDLKAMMDAGRFRRDLYYRVSTFPILLPALRERPADIVPLATLFAQRIADRLNLGAPKRLSAEALQALGAHTWPGNVRELENVVEYATIQSMEREEIRCCDLPEDIGGAVGMAAAAGLSAVVVTSDGLSLRTAVTNLERELILQSLRLSEGNKARAAELLDLKRTTFLEKLRRLEEDGQLQGLYPERSSADGSSGCAA
jgi:DNA-binding NtrC family response regulator